MSHLVLPNLVSMRLENTYIATLIHCDIYESYCYVEYRYVESNPQYAESSVYLVKFRQLQVPAIILFIV